MTDARCWLIRVDTGGTFTDAIARSPDGSLTRAKILSTSSLRATLLPALDGSSFECAATWKAHPDTLRDLRVILLPSGDTFGRVPRFDEAAARLVIERSPGTVGPALPATVELRSDEAAPVFAARLLTGTATGRPLPPVRMRLATTLGTNALLERRGELPVLFVTRGFADLLLIGTQQRPDLFAREIHRARPLCGRVVEVPGRFDARGRELQPLDLEALESLVSELRSAGARSAAVALMYSWLDPSHELRVANYLTERGFEHVSCSAELACRIKLLPRAETAVVNAFLAPTIERYVRRIECALGGRRLLMMTSAGALAPSTAFRPKDGLLSGPAGGVAGAAAAGARSGHSKILAFDMGGTSTDVARHDGQFEYVYEHRVGQARLAAPALAIETVAAGGGSVCWLDGERLRVGPQSAGAEPGPACYGAGGPLTLTDVNLLLGRLDPRHFGIPIRVAPARHRLDELLDALELRTGDRPDAAAILAGALDVANERMADATRRVSIRCGYDPADYAMVAFGGAGGQHACAVAERLGVERVLVPADAALLSAVGLDVAQVERIAERQVLRPLSEVEPDLDRSFEELADSASRAVEEAERDASGARPHLRRRTLALRLSGQETALEIEWSPDLRVRDAFDDCYERIYGYRTPSGRAVEVEALRVVVTAGTAPTFPALRAAQPRRPAPARQCTMVVDGRRHRVPLFDREALAPGDRVDGPALVVERNCATVVEAGWSAAVDRARAIVLQRTFESRAAAQHPEAVRLELFTQRFTAIVREMGEQLERTAVSTNVKERLDFSCALLDPDGKLVANAPHIPVHLGAIGLCVRAVVRKLAPRSGDVFLTNHPAFGGSHLPDVTVITPVFDGDVLLGFTASRAHHAEIGGTRPGSMPFDASRLVEEGVVLAPMRLVDRGRPRWEAVRAALEGGPYPSRNVDDNLADIRAAVAANRAGALALARLVRTHGTPTVHRYMSELERLAEREVRRAFGELGDGRYEAQERLDDGTRIRVAVDVRGTAARIDFSGSEPLHRGNLNATPAIVSSAVLYVVRLMVRRPLPLNEGLLAAVELVLPCCFLSPEFGDDPRMSPAVVGGNVETSQRLVDTLLRALNLAACSQGTMNNVIFGNDRYGFYETLGGGAGATEQADGADAVHTHMTNTRITDAEVLERRFPVIVERCCVRRDSGGPGSQRGGDGMIRELRFLEETSLSLLTQHRTVAPYGAAGGAPGKVGRQFVVRRGGDVLQLAAVDGCEVADGDRLIVETPGGGGWGRPADS